MFCMDKFFISSFQLEQIADAKTIMAIWYWEMQHFKKEVEDNA